MEDTNTRWDDGMSDETKIARRLRAKAWNLAHREMIAAKAKLASRTPQVQEKRRAYAQLWTAQYPWYASWQAAQQRCTNPKHKSWLRYGGRGITFNLSKSDMTVIWARDWTPDMDVPTLDRINIDGHYTLDNCRLISLSDNLRRKAGQAWTPERRAAAGRGRKTVLPKS